MGFQQIGAAIKPPFLLCFARSHSTTLSPPDSAVSFAGHAPMQATADHDRLPQPSATCPAEISETAPLFHSVAKDFSPALRQVAAFGVFSTDRSRAGGCGFVSGTTQRSGQVVMDFVVGTAAGGCGRRSSTDRTEQVAAVSSRGQCYDPIASVRPGLERASAKQAGVGAGTAERGGLLRSNSKFDVSPSVPSIDQDLAREDYIDDDDEYDDDSTHAYSLHQRRCLAPEPYSPGSDAILREELMPTRADGELKSSRRPQKTQSELQNKG
ncbi:hypothetical protein AXF42_Ash017271 [Apostasia shenzhenica]|uniref:Uncharacterized protein n=1 Tax=Apostasia shenzhenica TaxID=1088818 RepID=A0A2H9ZVN0_9ASPA|nr:hypothetical protein AXF42_Ash017271 [Apostasia shenzhenica]